MSEGFFGIHSTSKQAEGMFSDSQRKESEIWCITNSLDRKEQFPCFGCFTRRNVKVRLSLCASSTPERFYGQYGCETLVRLRLLF
jgi:hypothetical protein